MVIHRVHYDVVAKYPIGRTNNVLRKQWTNIPHTVLEKLLNWVPRIVQPVLPVSEAEFFDEQEIWLFTFMKLSRLSELMRGSIHTH